jgi:bla regulator protein blaR1
MNSLTQLFPAWTETLGWTLLHSLWQCLAILALVILIIRFIPSKLSQVRYSIFCVGMALMLMTSVGTFIYLFENNSSAPDHFSAAAIGTADRSSVTFTSEIFANDLESILSANMSLIVLCWIAGTILFSLRMVSGWWYISKLKSETIVPEQQLLSKLAELASELNMNRFIKLAYSNKVTVPIVLGYVKPVILIPVTMLSGLSAQQIETILVHELAHIKRHDYLINILQSIIETILFFNPFVWMISVLIRREREYCCDDIVLARHGSALVYAKTLTQLEEIRLSNPAFGLSLAQNKNQLLNRIRRIMENSAKNYSGREKVIPAAVIVAGLVCASWLTLSADAKTIQEKTNETEIAADTSKRNKVKSSYYSKQVIRGEDEKGEPYEEIVESYDGDDEFKSTSADLAFDIQMPQFPAFPAFPDHVPVPDYIPASPVVPALPHFDVPIPPMELMLDGDSIPKRYFGYRTEQQWDEFSKEFEKKFQEQFGDFYKSHERDLEKMMKELEESFHEKFSDREDALMKAQTIDMREIQKIQEEAMEHARMAHKMSIQAMEERQRAHQDRFREMEEQRMMQNDHLKDMERGLKEMEANVEALKKELTPELIKDGYIGKNDPIEKICRFDNGDLEINGKKIKESDKKKYRELYEKYLRKSLVFAK